MSGMTNGIRKNNRIFIKEANLYIGKLFECNKGKVNKIDLYETKENDKEYLYDKGSGNFHLLPEKDNFYKISDEINTIMKIIKIQLEEKLKEVNDKNIEYKRTNRVGGNLYYKRNPEGFKGGHLFAYIRVIKDNVPYDLMPIRFYIDDNNNDDTVNCILKSYQFSKGEIEKSYRYYPLSPDSDKSRGTKELMYYNPDTSFKDTDKIVEEFLKFVIEN
ncbi:MAG: hypothetical protein E7252_01620 [Lachnospira sp.]|nr:hypothetical protein [Lachnospira sp.]